MSCALVLHGATGEGKTSACLRLIERARLMGINAAGVLSQRVFLEGKLIGYDAMDVVTGEAFALARLRRMVDDPDWFVFGRLIYAFSATGFKRANEILVRSVESLDPPFIVVVDEFGRLEKSKLGLYPGAATVANKLRSGGLAVFTCRSDLVESVEALVREKAQAALTFQSDDVESLWLKVFECVRR